jgi:hypothetical protein
MIELGHEEIVVSQARFILAGNASIGAWLSLLTVQCIIASWKTRGLGFSL